MITILEYGQLSNAVYEDSPSVPGFTCRQFHSGLGEGMQAAVFTKGQKTVVAFKGTTPTQVSDLVADLKIGTGFNTSYFSAAERFTQQYANVPDLVVTGHSLGGAIAQTVGNRRRIPFVSFNAPGVAILASQNLHTANVGMFALRVAGGTLSMLRHPMQAMRDIGSAFHDSLGINVRLTLDPVSMIGLHYGPVVNLSGAPDIASAHSMDTVMAALRRNSYGNVTFPG